MSTTTAAAPPVLPSKKRKASHDSAAAAAITAERPRKESEAGSSQASEDITTMALRAVDDGASIGGGSSKTSMNFPPKKRKASFDLMSFGPTSEGPLRKRKLSESRPRLASLGSLDDMALGLGPLDSGSGSILGVADTMTSASHASIDHDAIASLQQLPSSGALEHLEALGDEASIAQSRSKPRPTTRDDDESQASSSSMTMANGDRQLLMEALMGNSFKRRDRFESWGGMSDISLTMGSTGLGNAFGDAPFMGEGAAAAAAIAASALQRPFLEDESDASTVSDADKPVPSKISLTRDRLYSIASLGEPSCSDGYEIGHDLQKFVAAAMASVGDQLAELAGVVETVAESTNSIGSDMMKDILRDDQSDIMSTASSLPEIQAELRRQRREDRDTGRLRSMSITSNPISVDYDAVAAAVDAANAATGAFDLASIAGIGRVMPDDTSSSLLPAILPSSTKDERDMEAMRARARAAAGYVPPENLKPGEAPPSTAKKRPKPATPSQKATYNKTKHQPYVPEQTYSMFHAANKASSQKWDEMYECLLEFVEQQKVDTRGMSEKEKKEVEWDGNVPTTYRTKDGKALGRWINNQRSAKHKGVLKKERELKLMGTGLKWSVLSTNSWEDMMRELQLYVSEKTEDGSEWDGNVPTNYKIKGVACLDEDGEERNLGRWINRQRSLYQSGKLRKDREMELESIGLKWSVLSTTSWQSMYDTLVEYVNERKAADGDWDGNVPANYKTNDVPPKALGRWINRQRTAHQKHKLKSEFAERLNSLGLKWSVHERRSIAPMSQMVTPIKSNVTVTKAQPITSSNQAGPIAAAAAKIAAAKMNPARPDEVKSNVTSTATIKPTNTVTAKTTSHDPASVLSAKSPATRPTSASSVTAKAKEALFKAVSGISRATAKPTVPVTKTPVASVPVTIGDKLRCANAAAKAVVVKPESESVEAKLLPSKPQESRSDCAAIGTSDNGCSATVTPPSTHSTTPEMDADKTESS